MLSNPLNPKHDLLRIAIDLEDKAETLKPHDLRYLAAKITTIAYALKGNYNARNNETR